MLYFPKTSIWIKILCNNWVTCQLKKPFPRQKRIAEKQKFERQSLYLNHRFLFDTKLSISPALGGRSYIMVIVDAFTHYVALNPATISNAFYAFTALYDLWIAKFR